MSDVSDLLARSHNAHANAKRVAMAGAKADPLSYRGYITDALTFRQQALAADPGRTDAAWQSEQAMTNRETDTHDALIAFYEDVLGR